MNILVAPCDFINIAPDLMYDIKDRLLGCNIKCKVDYVTNTIYIEPDIEIRFVPTTPNHIKGMRPDYYWTDNYDVEKYFKYCSDVKQLMNFTDLTLVILAESLKTTPKGGRKE